MGLDRQKVMDYLMTIDTEHSMSIAELRDKVDTMITSLLGYDRAYFVSGDTTVDVYGERIEDDEEYTVRVELETDYIAEKRKWLKEAA